MPRVVSFGFIFPLRVSAHSQRSLLPGDGGRARGRSCAHSTDRGTRSQHQS